MFNRASGNSGRGVIFIRDRVHNKMALGERRRELRKNLTPAEAYLWGALKKSQLSGRKFRRQHSVGNYVLDFYCDSEKLAVELDGEVHRGELAMEYDAVRTIWLRRRGIKTIRVENYLVFQELEYVLHRIESCFGWREREVEENNKNSPP